MMTQPISRTWISILCAAVICFSCILLESRAAPNSDCTDYEQNVLDELQERCSRTICSPDEIKLLQTLEAKCIYETRNYVTPDCPEKICKKKSECCPQQTCTHVHGDSWSGKCI